jgi:hypothetical protein
MKKIKILVAVILTSMALLPPAAKAQTVSTNVPNLMTNAPTIAGLQSDLLTIFGLYNPSVNYYADTNEFGVNMGISDGSLNPGLQQEIEPNFFHNFGSGMWGGLGVNVDTLGSAGNSIDEMGVHGYFKYASHNLAGLLGIGYQRDVDNNYNELEVGAGAEVYVTKNIGIFAKDFIEVKGLGKAGIGNRIVTGASWKF